jgi:arginine repressor
MPGVVYLNDKSVKDRLKDYLDRDSDGIRRAVLKLFLKNQIFTTEEIYQHLRHNGYDVSYRGVSAMVGLMNTKLGIFKIDVTKDRNIYSLKDVHKNTVKLLLDTTVVN